MKRKRSKEGVAQCKAIEAKSSRIEAYRSRLKTGVLALPRVHTTLDRRNTAQPAARPAAACCASSRAERISQIALPFFNLTVRTRVSPHVARPTVTFARPNFRSYACCVHKLHLRTLMRAGNCNCLADLYAVHYLQYLCRLLPSHASPSPFTFTC